MGFDDIACSEMRRNLVVRQHHVHQEYRRQVREYPPKVFVHRIAIEYSRRDALRKAAPFGIDTQPMVVHDGVKTA